MFSIVAMDGNQTMIHSLMRLTIYKNRGRFGKFLWIFRVENVLFLCCGKARETKENVFNKVVYIFRMYLGAFPHKRGIICEFAVEESSRLPGLNNAWQN